MYVHKDHVFTVLDNHPRHNEIIFDHVKRNIIFERKDQAPFRQSDWNFTNEQWRRDNVEEFFEIIRDELGISNEVIITWIPLPQDNDGRFDENKNGPNEIQLNSRRLTDTATNSRFLLTVLIHEARHAYQYEAVNDPSSLGIEEFEIRTVETFGTPPHSHVVVFHVVNADNQIYSMSFTPWGLITVVLGEWEDRLEDGNMIWRSHAGQS